MQNQGFVLLKEVHSYLLNFPSRISQNKNWFSFTKERNVCSLHFIPLKCRFSLEFCKCAYICLQKNVIWKKKTNKKTIRPNFWRTEKIPSSHILISKGIEGKLPETWYIDLFIHSFWILKFFLPHSFRVAQCCTGFWPPWSGLLSVGVTGGGHTSTLTFADRTLIFLWLCSEVESRLRALARSRGKSHDHVQHSAPGNRK